MGAYERKTLIQKVLRETATEADVLLGFISEQDTIVVLPWWECEMTTPEVLEFCARHVVRLADELSEGDVIGVFMDKRGR